MKTRRFFSLCLIVKNEGQYLREWLNHHVLAGAEHFYLYDNDSNPPAAQGLEDFLAAGLITLTPCPGQARQLEAYNDCLARFGSSTHWLGFIDCDEFILPRQHQDLKELLLDYEDQAGLALNCLIFGSSGHLTRPSGAQTRNYQRRFPLEHGENCLIKSIVQPRRTVEAAGVHHFHYKPGNWCVNERLEPVFGPFSPVCADKIRINHYFYRSQQDYCLKLQRGHADLPPGVMKYNFEQFYHQAEHAWEHDQEIAQRFDLEGQALDLGSRGQAQASRQVLVSQIQTALGRGDWAQALSLARAYVMSRPDSAEAWLLLGVCQNQGQGLAQARQSLYRSIRLRETIEAYFQVFLSHARQGQHPEARRIASYLAYRFSRTDFVRQGGEYAQMAQTLAAYLSSAPTPHDQRPPA